MKVLIRYCWLAGFYLLMSVSNLYAQDVSLIQQAGDSGRQSQINEDHHPWWVNLGAGPALVGAHFALNAGMIYCYHFERSIISARMLGVTNDNPTAQTIDRSTIIYKMADYGILYGPMWQSEHNYISVGAGIGLVRAAYESPSEIITNTSVSIPLELQWFWRPTRFAGIGVYTFMSLNFEETLYGLMLCAQLGVW